MTKPLIVVGDKTDHGGAVLTGSGVTLIDGKSVACVGDSVSCPLKGIPFKVFGKSAVSCCLWALTSQNRQMIAQKTSNSMAHLPAVGR